MDHRIRRGTMKCGHCQSLAAAVAALAVLILAGCASSSGLHPQGHLLDPAALPSDHSLEADYGSKATWPSADWWIRLGDPQLDALTAEALTHSPDLTAADARARQATAQAEAADAARRPTLDATADLTSERLSPSTWPPEAGGGTFTWVRSTYLAFNGSPDLWGGQRAAWLAALGQARVAGIDADDGDLVHAGQALVRFDPSQAQVALSSAEANLAQVVRQVRGLYSSLGSAQAEWAARRVEMNKASADYARRRDLAASGAISAEELAHARDALAAAQSALTAAQQQVQTSKVLVDDTVVASHPEVQIAAAKVRSAYLDWQHTTLVAPVAGYVARRTVQVGQRVAPGEPLMAVVPLHAVWIDANFTETQLTAMRIGQPVRIESDLYGGAVHYDGRVESLGVGTGSAFALLPAQNATGNWIKIVQRVPVRIVLTHPDQLDAHPLRVGLSMRVRVDLHDQRGPLLAQQSPTRPVLDTTVYRDPLVQAEALIARIIHTNNRAGDAKPEHP